MPILEYVIQELSNKHSVKVFFKQTVVSRVPRVRDSNLARVLESRNGFFFQYFILFFYFQFHRKQLQLGNFIWNTLYIFTFFLNSKLVYFSFKKHFIFASRVCWTHFNKFDGDEWWMKNILREIFPPPSWVPIGFDIAKAMSCLKNT